MWGDVVARIGPKTDRLERFSLAIASAVVHALKMAGHLKTHEGQGQGDSIGQDAPQPVPSVPVVVAPGIAMDEALSRWKAEMQARGCKPGSIDRMLSTVERTAEWNGWVRTGQVDYSGAIAFLAAQRGKDRPWSGPTYDQAVSTLKVFGEFLRRSRCGPVDGSGRHENPLLDLQPSGEAGGDGSRAMTTEQARALIEASIDRHMRSRRAKGASPVFWLMLFHTGLRYAEGCSIRWQDVDLASGSIWTDPKWTGNKGGRRDLIPLTAELAEQLSLYRETVPHGQTDPVFPIVPNRNTFHDDREAAGIPLLDARRRKVSIHSTRKTFCTWIDATGAPRGLVSALARHAETLTEDRYVDHADSKLRELVKQIPHIWPSGVKIFSMGARKKVATASARTDTTGVKSELQPMNATVPLNKAGRPVRMGSDLTPRANAPGRSALVSDSTHAAVSSEYAIENGNGHFRPETASDSMNEALAQAVLANALFIQSQIRGLGGSSGAASDLESHPR